MTKRIMFFALMVAMVVMLLVPMGASAVVVDNTVNWYGNVFQGNDPFFKNDSVVAFLEGGTAKVQFVYMNNDTGSNLTVRPYIHLDWAGRYYGATTSVANGEPVTLGIEFAAPSAATAGLVEHGYWLGVEYQRDGGNYSVASTIGEDWTAPVGDDTYQLTNRPVIASSLQVWKSTDALAWTAVPGTAYTVTEWTGEVDFIDVPTVATQFTFNYSYYEDLGRGDGVTKAFLIASHPPFTGQVVDGSMNVYVTDETAKTITAQAASAYSFDAYSGEIVLTTAPTPNQRVFARYQYWDLIPDKYFSADAGQTFVVYSQAQLDAQNARLAVEEMWDSVDYLYAWQIDDGNPSLGSWWSYDALLGSATNNAVAAAEELDDAAYDLYVAGDFAGAKAKYDQAKAKMQEAITSQQTLVGGVEQSVTGLIAGAGGWLDAQGAKAQAEADSVTSQADAQTKKLKAEATKAESYGTFLILVGVFFVIVAVAFLLLAIGKFLLWRKPAQTT